MEWELLAGVREDDRRRVLHVARRRRFPRKAVIFYDGDPGDTLHLIASGHVGLRVTTTLGDDVMLRVLGAGEFFGELALVSPNAKRSATAVALDPVETLSLHKDDVHDLRSRYPSVNDLLLHAAGESIRRLSAQLLEALYVPVTRRVYRRLVELAELYGDPDAKKVTIPLTQDDLAGLAGTTRPSANRVLTAAQEAGFVRLERGRVQLVDLDVLRKRAG